MNDRNQVRRFVVNLLAIVGGFHLLVLYTPLSNLLAMPLFSIQSKSTKADAIVVLSGARFLDGSLNNTSLERTIAAVRLYRQGLAPRLLFTGGRCCGQSASALMAKLAVDLGVPTSVILLEEESIRTYESAINSAALLRANGVKRAILVTSPLHMLRAQLAFAAAGVSVYPVRAPETKLQLLASAVERISLFQGAIHEYLGLTYYRIRGWI